MERRPTDMEPESVPAVPVPRPAATVVLMRSGEPAIEVLLTRRPATMAFAANLHVFPGGAVDRGDRAAAAVERSVLSPDRAALLLGGDGAPEESLAAFVAAVRELWEESGVPLVRRRGGREGPATAEVERARTMLLAGEASIGDVAVELDLDLRTDLLVPLSRWVTPPFVDRRFDVRFFAAQLPPEVDVSFVGDEVVDHWWASPRAALDAMGRGEVELWIPTSATLQQLEHVADFSDVAARLASGVSQPIRLEDVDAGLALAVLPGAGGVGGQSVNAWVVGRREMVVIDPGDPSEAATDALLARASSRGGTVRGIAITNADPDHAAGAEALALRLGVPLFGGRGSGRDLPADVIELADGDPVPAGDLQLVALAAPGPRRDHTVFLAPDARVVVAGDLVGPGPSRSILGPPDVPAWIASLDRVAALAPRRLLPGHGVVPVDTAAAVEAQRRRLLPA